MTKYDSDMGDAIKNMLEHVERYATAYKREFDSDIGDDGVLGDGLREVLHGLNTLLNGPLGRHDGGTLSREIYRIAEGYGLADENGEV